MGVEGGRGRALSHLRGRAQGRGEVRPCPRPPLRSSFCSPPAGRAPQLGARVGAAQHRGRPWLHPGDSRARAQAFFSTRSGDGEDEAKEDKEGVLVLFQGRPGGETKCENVGGGVGGGCSGTKRKLCRQWSIWGGSWQWRQRRLIGAAAAGMAVRAGLALVASSACFPHEWGAGTFDRSHTNKLPSSPPRQKSSRCSRRSAPWPPARAQRWQRRGSKHHHHHRPPRSRARPQQGRPSMADGPPRP